MTISIKPTASGSTIEQDGSTILTVDGSGNISAENNFTATGHVLQTVEFTNNTQVIVNTTVVAINTPYDTLTKATITPSSTSSKILIFVQQSWFQSATSGSQGMGFRVQRDSTYITTPAAYSSTYQGASVRSHGFTPIIAYDSPNTTSSVTYTVMGYHHVANGEVRMQYAGNESPSSIILMEIAG